MDPEFAASSSLTASTVGRADRLGSEPFGTVGAESLGSVARVRVPWSGHNLSF
jgi:hypothetical protein